jgi:hypothetical protein
LALSKPEEENMDWSSHYTGIIKLPRWLSLPARIGTRFMKIELIRIWMRGGSYATGCNDSTREN